MFSIVCLFSYYPLQLTAYYFLVYKLGSHDPFYTQSASTAEGLGQIGVWISLTIALVHNMIWQFLILTLNNWQKISDKAMERINSEIK